MAAQHTRSFGREAVAVYLAAALLVLGTWAASRYLILRKFEYIEQNDVEGMNLRLAKARAAVVTDFDDAAFVFDPPSDAQKIVFADEDKAAPAGTN